jgi:hypothetical protein
MPLRALIASLCLVLAFTAVPARAATEEAVKASREKGIEFLKEKQVKAGNWEFKGHEVGITALCTIALIENGVPLNDPIVQKGYEYVRENSLPLKDTYDISLAVVLLSRIGDRRDRPRIKALAARLIAGQLQSGGWTYTCPLADPDVITDRSKLPPQKEGFGDNSCTQFAVLGLWVASRTGIDIDRTLIQVAKRFSLTQLKDGGWHYNLPPDEEEGTEGEKKDGDKKKEAKAAPAPKAPAAKAPPGEGLAPGVAPKAPGAAPGVGEKTAPKAVSSGPMTGAGLFCLAVAQAAELREYKKNQGKKDAESTDVPTASLLENPIFSRGLKRTGDFAAGIGGGGNRYFMWSVERIGVLLGLDKLGETDWYTVGADGLIAQQQETGGWTSAWTEADPEGLSDTAFAILFLRKANLGSDISRLLEGEKDQKFQIVGRTPEARFESLEDALAQVKAGETIRIDSDGPFKLGHLELTKDITIQSGFGYSTVFKFEIGKNRLGIKLKPETDPNARDMITVKGAKVTLEGIKLQMDAPPLKQPVPWRAIAFQGGTLRLLNCQISEAAKQGMTGVAVEGEGTVVLRNSVIIGGRSGVEVTAAGKQTVVLDNSVIFSNLGVVVQNDAKTKKPADVTLTVTHSAIQAKEAFRAAKLTGKVAIDSQLSVFQAEAMGLAFLSNATAKDRTWKGDLNIFDVKQWLGSDGKTAVPAVKDLATWGTFWGGADKKSSKRIAPFVGVRAIGSFSHEVFAQDWTLELPGDAEVDLVKNLVGVNSFMAGPGIAYDQYRETISYTAWRKGELGLGSDVAAK